MDNKDFAIELESVNDEKLVDMLVGTTQRSALTPLASEMAEANADLKTIREELIRRLSR